MSWSIELGLFDRPAKPKQKTYDHLYSLDEK